MVVGSALLHCNKVDYFKIDLSSIHHIKRIEVQNSQKIGEELTEPLPRPLPRSFSEFVLESGFAISGPPTVEVWLRPRPTRGLHIILESDQFTRKSSKN